MIRVVFVNREMAMHPGGGGEMVDVRLATALSKLRVQVKFLVGKPLFCSPNVPFKAFPCEYVTSPYLRDWYQKIPSPFNILLGLLDLKLFSMACLSYLKRHDDYDILQVLSVPQLIKIKKYKKVPVVMRFPGPPGRLYKNYIKKIDAVIANGAALLDVRKHFRKDAVEIQIGVDHNQFKPSPVLRNQVRKKLGIKNEPVIHYNGRFQPIKNVSLLIRAMRFVVDQKPMAKLLLVGEGPLEGKLRCEVKQLGLQENVIFAGWIPGSHTHEYYAASDIFCMPSLYDNFPNSVLEAMSSALPVIATNVGGMPLQVKNGKTGFLVPSGDETAMAQRMLELLNNPSKARKMGIGRHWVMQHFDWDASARKLKNLYESLLRKY